VEPENQFPEDEEDLVAFFFDRDRPHAELP
jgi:hypothetical protein